MINENIKYYEDRYKNAERLYRDAESESVREAEWYQVLCESKEALKRWQELKEYLDDFKKSKPLMNQFGYNDILNLFDELLGEEITKEDI